jgi:hypothetical protein
MIAASNFAFVRKRAGRCHKNPAACDPRVRLGKVLLREAVVPATKGSYPKDGGGYVALTRIDSLHPKPPLADVLILSIADSFDI